jgi:hypothetical protein
MPLTDDPEQRLKEKIDFNRFYTISFLLIINFFGKIKYLLENKI